MAKIYGLFGALTGKLADTVMSVRNGEQIARKYQPVVFNPSTKAQVAQRAKLKLLSQLSAVLGDAIAFRRLGSVSSRNLFTKANFPLLTYDNSTSKASVNVAQLNLTGGVVALPAVTATRAGGQITPQLASAAAGLDEVVYVTIQEQADNKLRVVNMQVVTVATPQNVYPGTAVYVDSDNSGYVLAYGIRFNDEAARTRYSDLVATSPSAFIEVVRNNVMSDITLTETQGVAFATANRNVEPEDEPKKKE